MHKLFLKKETYLLRRDFIKYFVMFLFLLYYKKLLKKLCKVKKIILLLLIFFSFIFTSFSQNSGWISIGGMGNTITRLHFNISGDTLFVGTIEGYRFYSLCTSLWVIREMQGYIGRTVWSISYIPGYYSRVITGRENAFYKGYLELNDNFSIQGTIVRNSQGGRFTDIKYCIDNPNIIFACGWSDITPGDLVKSTNGGANWALLSTYLHTAMSEIAINPLNTNTVYVSGNAKITKSTNLGETWLYSNNGLPSQLGCYCVAISPFEPQIMLTSNDSGIYRSTDAGANWYKVYGNAVFRRIAFHPTFQGLTAGITFSPYKLLISTNNGLNWADSTNAFPANNMVDLAFSSYDNNLYVASSTSGVYKRLYLITGVKEEKDFLIENYLLFQNYPNPFNNYSIIKFNIPLHSNYKNVSLRIYDLTGREVKTLINKILVSGTHYINFDGTYLQSGIFFYKLEIEGYYEVRKMILIK